MGSVITWQVQFPKTDCSLGEHMEQHTGQYQVWGRTLLPFHALDFLRALAGLGSNFEQNADRPTNIACNG